MTTEAEFQERVEPLRSDVHAHCYRMLGSVQDAEDALQETMLRAWRSLDRYEGRASMRTWLHRIATNACLDLIHKRPKRVMPVDYGPPADPHDGPPADPLVESIWIEPYPDEHLAYEERESVELAFVAALQYLPPTQRAVLIQREVLGFSAKEVAETLNTSVASINSALQRARKAVDEKVPAQSQQATVRALGDSKLQELVAGYVDAWERADVDAVAAMLTDDSVIAMPPRPTWFRGRDDCAGFLRGYAFARTHAGRRLVRTSANGQLAFATYTPEPDTGEYRGRLLQVVTLDGPRIADITAFIGPEILPRFGLEPVLR